MNRLLLYRNFEHEDLVYQMRTLAKKAQIDALTEDDLECYENCIHQMIEMAAAYGLQENLWHSVLACILANAENAFSKACEKKGLPQGTLSKLVLPDISFWKEMFVVSLEDLDRAFGCSLAALLENYVNSNTNGHVFNKRIRDSITELGKNLGACDSEEDFLHTLTDFYRDYGVGKIGLHKAFRIGQDNDGEPIIEPITCTEHVHLDDLVGYERQKKKLVDNTLSFVNGQAANNCLLFGDAGTGKSSSIKAIMNEFYSKGLRLIEVYKHQFKDLPKIISQIKSRNYKFIIYMDDLSFEEFEIEYKYLKAVIEGGLETKPDNVLIYATSNRRHLINWILQNFGSEYKVILVGDALMDMYELMEKRYDYRTGEAKWSGLDQIKRFCEHYDHLIWLNPEEPPRWGGYWGESYGYIARAVDMYPLTVDGLERGMKKLLVNR